jgi:hypothetical protein
MTDSDHPSDRPAQLPAIVRPTALTATTDAELHPAPADAMSNSSPPTSVTHTCGAPMRARGRFFAWCETRGLTLTTIRHHVALPHWVSCSPAHDLHRRAYGAGRLADPYHVGGYGARHHGLRSRSAVDRLCALSVAGIACQRGGKRLTPGSAKSVDIGERKRPTPATVAQGHLQRQRHAAQRCYPSLLATTCRLEARPAKPMCSRTDPINEFRAIFRNDLG